ncbi:uncharacterized protein TNCV_3713191 [Trichonephila clavipes]|nr:uncharacterized protein TNCV_3713191 [Trichonephila clavipes]
MLGEKVGNLMIYVKQEKLGNYEKIKQLVLKQFQPTPRVLLNQFRRSPKLPNENYVQFASRIEAMFDYYCKLRNVSEFNKLCQLIVAEQIINSLDRELTSYINLKMSENWYKPNKLGRELDLFMSSKVSSRNEINTGFRQNKFFKSGVDRKGLKGVKSVFLFDVNETKFSYCCENHAIPFCAKFKQLSVHDRIEKVKKQRLCFLCLRVGCTASKCKAKPCKLCTKRRHVSLHFPKQNTNFQTSHDMSNAFHPSIESRLNADARVFNPAFPPEKVSEKDSNAVFAINRKKGSTSVFLSSMFCKRFIWREKEGKRSA